MEEALPPCGRSMEGGVGVSRTGPGVITLIDTSPHMHAHGPQGPIRGLGLQRREDGRLAQVLPARVSGV